MKSNFSVNKEFLLRTAKEILEFNSPTGFCFEIMDKIEAIIKPLDITLKEIIRVVEQLLLKEKTMKKQ